MNSYIQTNFATEEAADIELAAAAADDSISTDAEYSASGVSISDDAEENINAVSGGKKSDVEDVGTLPNGYLRTNPLPQVPTKQSVLSSGKRLPAYLEIPVLIPVLCRALGPAMARVQIPL
jgi:hypothetical protein